MRKEATIEQWKDLYEIATKIREFAPWKEFWDTDLIYIKEEDIYVSIMGKIEETFGISIYKGEDGLNDFARLLLAPNMNITPMLAMYMQNNLTCYIGDREELSNQQRDIIKELGYKYRGRNQWMYFMSFKQGYMPYNFDQKEVLDMTRYFKTLHTVLQIWKEENPEIPFESGYILCYSTRTKRITAKLMPIDHVDLYTAIVDVDKELKESLENIQFNDMDYEVDILPMFTPIKDKSFERPANMAMCAILDRKSGIVLSMNIIDPIQGIQDSLMNELLDQIFTYGKPKRIFVANDLLEAVIRNLCETANIKLRTVESLRWIDNFMDVMDEMM